MPGYKESHKIKLSLLNKKLKESGLINQINFENNENELNNTKNLESKLKEINGKTTSN